MFISIISCIAVAWGGGDGKGWRFGGHQIVAEAPQGSRAERRVMGVWSTGADMAAISGGPAGQTRDFFGFAAKGRG